MTANWKRRWENATAELRATRREVTALRAALDELNADTEAFLSVGTVGNLHEKAKSHAIRSQMATIRSMRARLREQACPSSLPTKESKP